MIALNQVCFCSPNLSDLSDTLEVHNQLRLILSCTAIYASLLFTKTNGKIAGINFIISSLIVCVKCMNSVPIAQAVYCLVALKLGLERSKGTLFESILFISFLLHNESNVICIFLQIIVLHMLFKHVECNSETNAVMLCIFSKCTFFHLGNSNALSTIDVGAGYMGLSEYNALTVVVLLALHTFSGPLITFAYCLQRGTKDVLLKIYFYQTWLDLLVFCVLCTGLRYHIFVWTVFSPKLLYFGMELVVMLSLLIINNLYFAYISF